MRTSFPHIRSIGHQHLVEAESRTRQPISVLPSPDSRAWNWTRPLMAIIFFGTEKFRYRSKSKIPRLHRRQLHRGGEERQLEGGRHLGLQSLCRARKLKKCRNWKIFRIHAKKQYQYGASVLAGRIGQHGGGESGCKQTNLNSRT